jgi:tRNA pseudouridine55 synthase
MAGEGIYWFTYARRVIPSYDLETEPQVFRIIHRSMTPNKYCCSKFSGEISQVPPIHSAIKNKEEGPMNSPEGQEIILEPRKITIREFEIISVAKPLFNFGGLHNGHIYPKFG